MQPHNNPLRARDHGSPSGRNALLAMAIDLQLEPPVVMKALEHAWDRSSSYSSPIEALYFGLILQGWSVDMETLEIAVLELRKNYRDILGAQHASPGQLFAQVPARRHDGPSRHVVNAATQPASLAEPQSFQQGPNLLSGSEAQNTTVWSSPSSHGNSQQKRPTSANQASRSTKPPASPRSSRSTYSDDRHQPKPGSSPDCQMQ